MQAALAGPASSESNYAPRSDETHKPVSILPVSDQPPDQFGTQLGMNLQSHEKSSVRTWWWNFLATLRDTWRRHQREKPLSAAPSVRESIITIFKASWLNVLLIFIPLSWIFHFVELSSTLVFVFSFLAIIPLAKLLAFATNDMSLRFGQTPAGLLNATLGNAVELIVAIIVLVKCELTVVQSSLIGSILSNLLLGVGMCFFAGGTKFSEQGFGISAVQLDSSLLTLGVIAVLLPAAFHNAIQLTDADHLSTQKEGEDILSISRGVAVIFLFIYLCYLVFQLFSHKNLYEDHASHSPLPIDPVTDPAQRDAHSLEAGSEREDELEKPEMALWAGIALHVILTALAAVTAGFLVDSITSLTSSGYIGKGFVGLIILPIVGNAADHITAVTVSLEGEIMLSLGITVGSSIQTVLFVIPFTVTLGWILGKPLTLLFDPFESIVLFLSVLTVNYVVQEGKSNWLKGMILMSLYVIIAVMFWYYPVSNPAGLLVTCH